MSPQWSPSSSHHSKCSVMMLIAIPTRSDGKSARELVGLYFRVSLHTRAPELSSLEADEVQKTFAC